MSSNENRVNANILKFLSNKALHLKVPIAGTFELSPVCNFSCKMCYVRKTKAEVDNSLRPILNLSDWLRIANQMRDSGTLNILLTGGEPLLWPDFWELYEILVDMGFLVSINTNGSLIDEAAVLRFCERPPYKINLTLYGANDETYLRLCGIDGIFSKVDNAIKLLVDNEITVKINCSLTPENAKDLDWIVDYAKQRDIPLQVATYMFPPVRRDPSMFGENERFTPQESAYYLLRYLERDRGKEAYKNYLQNIVNGCVEPPGLDEGCIDPIDGKIRCRAGRSSFWVTWDGWLTPCGMMPDPKVDLKTHSFSDAWKEITELSGALRLSSICDKCPNHEVCHPCAAIAYAETGQVSEIPKYMCEVSKEMQRIARETLGI